MTVELVMTASHLLAAVCRWTGSGLSCGRTVPSRLIIVMTDIYIIASLGRCTQQLQDKNESLAQD